MDYCCQFSPLQSTGKAVSLYRIRSLSCSTADVFAVAANGDGASILDSLTAPCFVYNTAMYTAYGRCGQYGRCMVHTLAGAASVAGACFTRTQFTHSLRCALLRCALLLMNYAALRSCITVGQVYEYLYLLIVY